jgi:hypothetical protein
MDVPEKIVSAPRLDMITSKSRMAAKDEVNTRCLILGSFSTAERRTFVPWTAGTSISRSLSYSDHCISQENIMKVALTYLKSEIAR